MKIVEQLITQSLTAAESETVQSNSHFHTQILGTLVKRALYIVIHIRLLLFFTVNTRNRKSCIQL